MLIFVLRKTKITVACLTSVSFIYGRLVYHSSFVYHVLSYSFGSKLFIVVYRVSQELRSRFRDLIPELILSQKLHTHTHCPIGNGSGIMSFKLQ